VNPKNANAPGKGRASQHNTANSGQYPADVSPSSPAVIAFMRKPSFEAFLRAFPTLNFNRIGSTFRDRTPEELEHEIEPEIQCENKNRTR
jgi:hypothetical protein